MASDSSISARVMTLTGTMASSSGISLRVAVTTMVSDAEISAENPVTGAPSSAAMTTQLIDFIPSPMRAARTQFLFVSVSGL